jgi:hypothetical protein
MREEDEMKKEIERMKMNGWVAGRGENKERRRERVVRWNGTLVPGGLPTCSNQS